MSFEPADFGPLRATGYGVGFHWTALTLPQRGEPLPFAEAVARFDVSRFVDQVRQTGAGHVLFTLAHARHIMPCPNAEMDAVLPGHTCERDLIMDLAEGLREAGVALCLYYHHGISSRPPASPWELAAGAGPGDSAAFYDRHCRILEILGERYGRKVTAWWFDSAQALARLGATPWERIAEAARAGHPGRLLCHNTGIEQHALATPCQDYWSGEICRLNYLPRGEYTPGGLPWYAFVSWHGDSRKPLCGVWVMDAENRPFDWPPPPVESVVRFVRRFQAVGGVPAFNLLCYQDGRILETDLEVMGRVADALGRAP
ncbi:MAG: hypothetical protein JXR77_08980 [Lentisphaeria bacterium]|nr:hypothetical protein [Lentisphaeria bacterium]